VQVSLIVFKEKTLAVIALQKNKPFLKKIVYFICMLLSIFFLSFSSKQLLSYALQAKYISSKILLNFSKIKII
jgi:hypothetical protein